MHGPAIGKEPLWVSVSVEAKVHEASDFGLAQAQTDEARQIEHEMAVSRRRREEFGVSLRGRDEALKKLRTNFVALLRDRRPYRREPSTLCRRPAFPLRRASPQAHRSGRLSIRRGAAPMTRALGSAKRIMPQSAPVTARATPGVALTSASQRGRSTKDPVATTASAE